MALTKIQTAGITDGTVGADDLASTIDLSSKTVTLPAASVTAHVTAFDDNQLKEEIALLGFRVASNGSLAKYNLVDQTVDDFQDTSGVNAGGSTNEIRDSSGKYYTGETTVSTGTRETHTATPSGGTWTAPAGATAVEVLVVAGGGGGGSGNYSSGGGGAGGLVYHASKSVTPSSAYTLTVGAGGTCVSGDAGNAGANSVFSDITAVGGGGGGARNASGSGPGRDGGSGGGGGSDGGSGANYAGGSGTQGNSGGGTGFGNDGGDGAHLAGNWEGGGGCGGAGAAGGDRVGGAAGSGGVGRAYTIADGTTSVYYAGGGGGSGNSNGAGGNGGGGAGGGSGTAGTANTGGGGGAAYNTNTSGVGGSGVVILNYTASSQAPADMTLVSATTAAQAAPTKGDIVLTYTNGAGTTTLDTDLTAEISADGGSTWTALALGSEGSTGAHNIATSHDVTISSTITSPWNMAYRIKTLNQSANKTTRIQAVSLGWS